MLKIEGLKVSYGGISALKGIDIEVKKGQIVTLIGANGAGKSTTLKATIGMVESDSGRIIYKGEDITDLSIGARVEKGMVLVPEGRRVFPQLTVGENLLMGAYVRKDYKEIEKDINWIYKLFPILEERSWQLAGTLSGGEQQMLAVGRALAARPELIMMDEPSLGLAPLIVKEIFNMINIIRDEGVTILLIEQNANLALNTCDWGYVMETGTLAAEGEGKDLLEDESIKEAYLGRTKN